MDQLLVKMNLIVASKKKKNVTREIFSSFSELLKSTHL
jgi:hypothetical protein